MKSILYRPSPQAITIIEREHKKALKTRPKQSRNTTLDEIIIKNK